MTPVVAARGLAPHALRTETLSFRSLAWSLSPNRTGAPWTWVTDKREWASDKVGSARPFCSLGPLCSRVPWGDRHCAPPKPQGPKSPVGMGSAVLPPRAGPGCTQLPVPAGSGAPPPRASGGFSLSRVCRSPHPRGLGDRPEPAGLASRTCSFFGELRSKTYARCVAMLGANGSRTPEQEGPLPGAQESASAVILLPEKTPAPPAVLAAVTFFGSI